MKLNIHDLSPQFVFSVLRESGRVVGIKILDDNSVEVNTGYLDIQWDE